MKIIVLGAGQMGKFIASDLSKDFSVSIADQRHVEVPNVLSIHADLSTQQSIINLVSSYDLVVGALPAALGFMATQATIRAKKNYVDVSFYAEDSRQLDEEAKAAGVFVLSDCGLAPGLTNLFVGRELEEKGTLEYAELFVGGISTSPFMPYGYKVSWSVADLLDEYLRPARAIEGGAEVALNPFDTVRAECVNGVPMESFVADGCRTLLYLKDRVANMHERTLRWPGYMKKIKPLVEGGTFISKMQERCVEGTDTVVFQVRFPGKETTMITHGDEVSAMAKTTAYTTAAFARLAANGLTETGVLPPEKIGQSNESFGFILSQLARYGIVFTTKTK